MGGVIRITGTTRPATPESRGTGLFPLTRKSRRVDTTDRTGSGFHADPPDSSLTHSPGTEAATMSSENSPPLTDLQIALQIVNKLEKQARQIDDPELKRILLTSGCDIIDRVMDQQQIPKAA